MYLLPWVGYSRGKTIGSRCWQCNGTLGLWCFLPVWFLQYWQPPMLHSCDSKVLEVEPQLFQHQVGFYSIMNTTLQVFKYQLCNFFSYCCKRSIYLRAVPFEKKEEEKYQINLLAPKFLPPWMSNKWCIFSLFWKTVAIYCVTQTHKIISIILQDANANLHVLLNKCLQFAGKYSKYNTFWILLLYDRKLLLLVYSSDYAYTLFFEN